MANSIARSLDLCNQLVSLAQTVPGFPSGDGSKIQRTYVVDVNVDPNDPTTFIWGRQVYFFPKTQYSNTGDRASLLGQYVIGITGVEMFLATPAVFNGSVLQTPGTIGAGQPPDSWVDERVTWFEALYDEIKQPGFIDQNPGVLGLSYFSTADLQADITLTYHADELMERKLFWCEMEFTYHGFQNNAGTN